MRIEYRHELIDGLGDADVSAQLNALVAEGWQVSTFETVPYQTGFGPILCYSVLLQRITEDAEPQSEGMRVSGGHR